MAPNCITVSRWYPDRLILHMRADVIFLSLLKLHNLIDAVRRHMLISKTKPCMSKYKFFINETANSSLKQL